ncbi:MAG: hypothetical protein O2887_17475 [Bacteroidetes bacterium]|nr:hypothetical protein [Bacteroidota bacterium]MDA1122249.1 hypothetical protein [Bacteroidota bacterium]
MFPSITPLHPQINQLGQCIILATQVIAKEELANQIKVEVLLYRPGNIRVDKQRTIGREKDVGQTDIHQRMNRVGALDKRGPGKR